MTIEELNTEISRLIKMRDELQRANRMVGSRAIIEALGITRKDVTLSDEPGMPYWGHLKKFGDWLERSNISTRFCEWNGMLYYTAAVRKGAMIEVGCEYSDIPK